MILKYILLKSSDSYKYAYCIVYCPLPSGVLHFGLAQNTEPAGCWQIIVVWLVMVEPWLRGPMVVRPQSCRPHSYPFPQRSISTVNVDSMDSLQIEPKKATEQVNY